MSPNYNVPIHFIVTMIGDIWGHFSSNQTLEQIYSTEFTRPPPLPLLLGKPPSSSLIADVICG